MSDLHEQDTWDQGEVEIVDLGTPEKGLSRYFFTLGEKWYAAASLRVKLVALVGALSLLIAVLQPGSSFVNNQTPGAPHTVPAHPLLHTIYTNVCTTAISITPGQSITFTWHQISSTSSAQGCIFSSGPGSHCSSWQEVLSTSSTQAVVIDCSDGTPLPIPSGKNVKNP